MSLTELIDPVCSSPTEHQLNFALCDRSQGKLTSFRGNLIGPHCKYARTLPATFSVPPCACLPDLANRTQQTITDPCYWTPQLPYLYNFEGTVQLADGTEQSWSPTIGFRRWEVTGKNLRLERRRVVLRGAVAVSESAANLPAAHAAEVALLVKEPSDSFLQQASECGVWVIADLRSVGPDLAPNLLRLAWQPSVALVLVNSANSKLDFHVPPTITLGHTLHANALEAPANRVPPWASVLLVELDAGQTPPTRLANTDQPVIAIRHGEEYSDLTAARATCDRLQAELAPEFDLAGYFVAP